MLETNSPFRGRRSPCRRGILDVTAARTSHSPLVASVERGHLARAFVCPVDWKYAVLLYRRVKRRGDESEARGPIKGAAIVLLDGSKPQPLREVPSASTLCRDVEAKGRDSWVMATHQGGDSAPLAKLFFGTANFATQLAAQLSDDPKDVLTVSLSGFGPRQAGPRVAKRGRDRL